MIKLDDIKEGSLLDVHSKDGKWLGDYKVYYADAIDKLRARSTIIRDWFINVEDMDLDKTKEV